MPKRIIAVNAGPRKGWNTDTLIKEAAKGAEDAGAVNEPLSTIRKTALPKNEPIFLYCLRGSRSRKAAGILKKMPFGPHRKSGPKPSLRSGTPLRGWACTFCHHWMW